MRPLFDSRHSGIAVVAGLSQQRVARRRPRTSQQVDSLQRQHDEALDRLAASSQAALAGAGGANGGDAGALEQVRAVAEAAVRELRARLADREAALAAAAEATREHQASFLAQHATDR